MGHIIFSVIIIVTLTALPLSVIVGILTEPVYQNPFAYAMALLFIYIGVKAWNPTRKR
mgnify:CR=1 FL=1